MTLTLHVNAHEVDYSSLRDLSTPPPTETHIPIAHYVVVDHIKYALKMYDHEVTEEHFGVTEDGNRFFGLLSLRSTYGGYEDTVGLRNSHDKSFPIGIGYGSRVFVCDNLAFIADRVVKRKHTLNLKRDLPGLIVEMVEPLAVFRKTQAETIERYKSKHLEQFLADHIIMAAYRTGIINVTRIENVCNEWDKPRFDYDGGPHTAWHLLNAFTFALNGRVTERPDATPRLYSLISASI